MEKTQDIAQIIQGSIRSTFRQWERANMLYPSLTLKELSRRSGIPASDILTCILQGKVVLPNEMRAQIVDLPEGVTQIQQIVKEIKRPRNSRDYNETRALIHGEKQRYQRRFHLNDAKAKGKPTRTRIEDRVGSNQLLNTKIVFAASPPITRREEIKRKQAERAAKLLRYSERIPRDVLESVLSIFDDFSVLPGKRTLELINRVKAAIRKEEIEFMQFTCPPVDAKQLSTTAPEAYLLTNPKGNNFEGTAGRLQSLIRKLKEVGLSSKLSLIIGDNDEPEYIFPVIGSPIIDPLLAEERRKTYMREFSRDMRRKFPDIEFRVYRVSELEQASDLANFTYLGVSATDIAEETERMRDFFGDGSYYEGICPPTLEQLREMTQLKSQSYAKQGYILSTAFPNAILLQNEFPLEIRSRMLKASNTSNPLGIVYPYGRSTSLY